LNGAAPQGGFRGGLVIATGTPKQVAKNQASYTAQYLGRVLGVKAAAKASLKAANKPSLKVAVVAKKPGKKPKRIVLPWIWQQLIDLWRANIWFISID